jgi:hypothetical protein
LASPPLSLPLYKERNSLVSKKFINLLFAKGFLSGSVYHSQNKLGNSQQKDKKHRQEQVEVIRHPTKEKSQKQEKNNL